jgi:hypothetical protein
MGLGSGHSAAAALDNTVGSSHVPFRERRGGEEDEEEDEEEDDDDAARREARDGVGALDGDGDGAGTAGGAAATREERLAEMERELEDRAARGDVDLETDVGAMEEEVLKAHVNALRVYITSGLRRRVEEELVNDLAEQPSIDYVRTLEQQRDVARARLEEEVVKARDLQIAHNALRRQLNRAGRMQLGAPPADEESAAMLISRASALSRAGPGARRAAHSTVRASSRGGRAAGTTTVSVDQLPPLQQYGSRPGSRSNPLPTGALGPQRGGAAARGMDNSLARGMAQAQSAAELQVAARKRQATANRW